LVSSSYKKELAIEKTKPQKANGEYITVLYHGSGRK